MVFAKVLLCSGRCLMTTQHALWPGSYQLGTNRSTHKWLLSEFTLKHPIHDFRENGSTCITLRQCVSASVRHTFVSTITWIIMETHRSKVIYCGPNSVCFWAEISVQSPAFPGPKSRPRVQQFQNAKYFGHYTKTMQTNKQTNKQEWVESIIIDS